MVIDLRARSQVIVRSICHTAVFRDKGLGGPDPIACIAVTGVAPDRTRTYIDAVAFVVTAGVVGNCTAKGYKDAAATVVVATQGLKLAIVGKRCIDRSPPPVTQGTIADGNVILGTADINSIAAGTCCFARPN